jgi:hypothetical protein
MPPPVGSAQSPPSWPARSGRARCSARLGHRTRSSTPGSSATTRYCSGTASPGGCGTDLTVGWGVDLVLDPVGGPVRPESIELLAQQGRRLRLVRRHRGVRAVEHLRLIAAELQLPPFAARSLCPSTPTSRTSLPCHSAPERRAGRPLRPARDVVGGIGNCGPKLIRPASARSRS